ncbi:MAG: thiamine pyrophosphate-binding protein, partial [Rhizobiales bacterium]|nr:thiamine pyrophosphate-binding protein [Hyphomicrobiales bacterium]
MAKMTGGRFMAEFFRDAGVTAVFFVPTILSRPLAEMDDMPIKRVLCHAEKSAAYMADGYARACGRPGICGGQAVGAANLAAGLRDALLGNSPVIAFSGGRMSSQLHKGAYQENDDLPIYEQLTKANFRVDLVERLPDMMRQAFREATSGNPGPVNLQLFGNHGQLEDDFADMEVLVEPEFTQVPAYRPAPDAASVRKAATELAKAKRPVMVIGGGARASGAGPEAIALAEKMSIPIATSVAAYAMVPENHPLNVGVPGTYSRSCANQVLMEADLVLYVGSKTGGQVTHFWQVPAPGTPAIQIGINPSDLGRNYPNPVSLAADAKVALEMLTEVAQRGGDNAGWVDECQKKVAAWREEAAKHRESSASPIRPERWMKEIGDNMPENALVVSDTGHTAMWAVQQLWVDHTNWDFIRCAGSLGWGFPAAIGAKCAVPERPVICVTGDGGLWYHLTELETAVRHNIPTVTIVNNNSALNQEYSIFTAAYDGKPSDKWKEMWYFNKVSFAKLAEDMGALGIRVEDPSELGGAIKT